LEFRRLNTVESLDVNLVSCPFWCPIKRLFIGGVSYTG
jgi:hypothetical protein